MEHASTPARTPTALDAAVLAAEARQAAGKATEAAEPAKAIDDAVGAFHDAIAGIFPCVFVLEHGRLWLVAQRGYAAVPDGLKVDRGIMGRRRPARASATCGRRPLRSGLRFGTAGSRVGARGPTSRRRVVVGALNIESERTLPNEAAQLLRPLVNRLCKSLVFVVGATACSASKVDGDFLMLPLRVGGRIWGLVELYERRLRRFTADDIGIARLLATQAERRLEVVGSEGGSRRRPRVYELPPEDGEPPRIPRIR